MAGVFTLFHFFFGIIELSALSRAQQPSGRHADGLKKGSWALIIHLVLIDILKAEKAANQIYILMRHACLGPGAWARGRGLREKSGYGGDSFHVSMCV